MGSFERAVQIVQERAGVYEYVAREIVRDVLACADETFEVRQQVDRPTWEHADYAGHLRERMRRELLAQIASKGYIPVDLPTESREYYEFPAFTGDPNTVGAGPIPAEYAELAEAGKIPWQTVVVRLQANVRRPEVDWRALVRAGAL